MHTDVAGDSQGLPGRAVVLWSTQELLWLLRQSQIPLPLPPYGKDVWDVKAGRWQTLALQGKSWSRMAVSTGKRWGTGTPADAS